MIVVRKSDERGFADHGWLRTHHSFSFADYYDREHMNFGPLRVLNQDEVAPGKGFGTHGHQNMEIVTVVLDGVLEHRDSMGNGSRLTPGEVQFMSAGSGVTHSEFNGSQTETSHFLQMWVFPRETETEPRYEERAFPEAERRGRLRLVVSPDGADGSLTIGQDARLYSSLLVPGERMELGLEPARQAYLHVATGSLEVNGVLLEAGDGAGIRDEETLAIVPKTEGEIVLWDLPRD